jgi:DNA-binding winged helix-turn-helix (wHTH) protein
MVHAFDEWELDDELFQLRRAGRVVELEPKVFDLLAYLLRHRQRVVTKRELLDALWPDVSVSESVLPRAVAAARRALDDDRRQPRVIQTIHGRGYRFVAAVRAPAASVVALAASASSAAGPPEPATDPARARQMPRIPFVGRERVMERLRQRLETACAGRGSVVLLVGEPGIGKTRTAEQIAAEARSRGAMALVGRASEGEGAPAFWPWVQILRACVRDAGPSPGALAAELSAELGWRGGAGAGAGEIAALVPEIGLPSVEEPSAQSPALELPESAQLRFRLFDGLASFLTRASARRPLVLVLDDLHWADEPSLRLLEFLAPEVRDAHLLAVATYRDTELRRQHPLAAVLGALAREPACERIVLRGFDAGETRRFIAAVSGASPPQALLSAVHEMTAGNPFFLREVVDQLESEGRLGGESGDTHHEPGDTGGDARGDGEGSRGDGERSRGEGDEIGNAGGVAAAALGLPESVRDAIGRRLSGLSRGCNETLRAASVFGREFSAALVERVGQAQPVLAALDEAAAAGVVRRVEGAIDLYAFQHPLVRQTLYEELSLVERLRLHGRAAGALEALYADDPGSHLAEVAQHYFAAAPAARACAARAVETCARAAAHARRLLAYEESARLCERALEALELCGGGERARRLDLLLSLGEARALAGARARALAAFERAAELARRLGRADALARAALGSREATELGAPIDGATLALLEEALAALGDGHPSLRAQLLGRLAGAPPHSHAMERREALSHEARALAQVEDEPGALRDAFAARLWACLGPDRVGERIDVAREILDVGERLGDRSMALLGYDGLLGAYLTLGDAGGAERALARYGAIARELRQPAYLFYMTFYEAGRALDRGEFDVAECRLREAFARGRGTVPYAHFRFAGMMDWLRAQRGDVEGMDAVRETLGDMLAMPSSWERAMRSSLVVTLALAGDAARARQELKSLAGEDITSFPKDEHWLVTMAALGGAASLLDERDLAARLYDLLHPYACLVVVHDLLRSSHGSVMSLLARLAATLRRDAEAAAHYEAAVAKETAMGARPALLITKAGYAALLRARGRARDRARADELLADVTASARAMGMRGPLLRLALPADVASGLAP